MAALRRRGVGKRSALIFVVVVVALGTLVGFAVAIKPKGGSYSGKTGQDEQVSFNVKNGYVSNAEYTIRSSICSGTFYIYDSDKVSKKGAFSITTSTNTLKGKFVTKKKVKGTAQATFSSCPGGTKTVSFTARRR
jgi:hypothetical protein